MPDPASEHKRKIVEQFTLQAVPFARSHGHPEPIRMMIDLCGVSAADRVLDVACGPGLVACEFAGHAGQVTGIDITPGMIEQARALQRDRNLQNISWQVGDVLPLPFPDARFDVVVTRYSFHHFLDPAAVLAEMIRVCRPGGRVMVVDVVMPEDKVDAYNRLEILRDPSHVKALALHEMEELIGRSGLSSVRTGWYRFETELEEMLSRSFPGPGDADRIRAMFEEDLGIDRMGVGAHRTGDAIHCSIPILVVVGEKPA
jgi:ubiquinone/menaquinone biosynthesis C-methylase UbiE